MTFFATKNLAVMLLLAIGFNAGANTDVADTASYHVGFLYPNGVDVAGYSLEKKIGRQLYRFYTFGYPAFAAAGFCYYQAFRGRGMIATLGVGIGSIMYVSAAYQWQLGLQDYLKLGAGFTTGVAYTGSHPVFSYEHRF